MTTCINCGKHTTNQGFFAICDDCNDASNKLTATLKSGITLVFSDGTTETLYLDEDCPELAGDGSNYDF